MFGHQFLFKGDANGATRKAWGAEDSGGHPGPVGTYWCSCCSCLVLPELSKRYHVFAVDYFGHGESTHDPALYTCSTGGNALIAFAEQAIGDNGRVLVRKSGTEPVIRVMVEAESNEICEKYVDDVIKVIEAKGHFA